MALLDDRFQEPDEAEALRAWQARYQAIMDSDMSAIEALRAFKALGPMPGQSPADGEA
jgi:hypothetical protein